MSFFIYAGSMQYVAVGLLSGGASFVTVALTTLMVNARHLFYGISMLEKYRGMGKAKPYLTLALTDETYSLVCRDNLPAEPSERKNYFIFVTVLNHFYWVLGSFLGSLIGTLVSFDTEGIDFALTALFVTVFTDQLLTAKKYIPALVGVGSAVICLLIFGSESFLIPTMLAISVSLLLIKDKGGEKNDD